MQVSVSMSTWSYPELLILWRKPRGLQWFEVVLFSAVTEGCQKARICYLSHLATMHPFVVHGSRVHPISGLRARLGCGMRCVEGGFRYRRDLPDWLEIQRSTQSTIATLVNRWTG
jgi:hypothetical protein